MIHSNELMLMLAGMVIVVFIITKHHQLKSIPAYLWLISSFFLLSAGWTLSVVEVFIYPEFLNYLEHLFYTSSTIMLMVWYWKARASHASNRNP
jgi:hypothetical protein